MSASFLARLAQARPDPGGGAAAAYSAGVGLALLTKVIRLEQGRLHNDKNRLDFWSGHLKAAQQQKKKLFQLQQADVEAYLAMAKTLEFRDDPLTHQWRVVEEAIRCPWQIMEQILAALEVVSKAGELCRRHLLADLLVATEILGGAFHGAYHIAAANLPHLPEGRRQKWTRQLSRTSHLGLEATLRVRSRLLARTHEA